MWRNSATSAMISIVLTMRVMAWNDPEIGIAWPMLSGMYKGTASAEGYLVDGVPLNLSEKDQKWVGIKETVGV